jgi:PAS domain S-box-containing protein
MRLATPHDRNESVDGIDVLLVDDDPAFARLAREAVSQVSSALSVETEPTPRDGLERLGSESFDCIVSDYDMPEMTGIEFLEAVRQEYPSLPFILYTGKGSEEVASQAISAGVTDYLQKTTGAEQYTLLANRVTNAVKRARAEQEIERTRAYFQAILTRTTDFVMVLDHDGNVKYVSPAIEDTLGCQPETAIGDDPLNVLQPTDRQSAETSLTAVYGQHTGQVQFECRARTTNGEGRWLDIRAWDMLSDPAVEGVILNVRDVSERKAAEQRARTERRFVQRIFDAQQDVLYTFDTDGGLLRWNDQFADITGYSDDELEGRYVTSFVPDSEKSRIKSRFQAVVETHESLLVESELETKVGDRIPFEFTGNPIVGRDGSLRGVTGIGRDISDRRERQERLERQQENLANLTVQLEEQYRVLFEEAPVMMVVTQNEAGEPIITDCNELFTTTLGYDVEQVIGRPLAEFYTEASRQALIDDGGYTRALNAEFTREHRDLVTNQGEVVETLLRAVPRRDDADDPLGTLAMYIDISEQAELERANERLEEFTRIVSHDLRNPLSIAKGNLEFARETHDSKELEAVARAHDRMERLIDDLLSLARAGDTIGERTPVALADLVEECWANVDTADGALAIDSETSVLADGDRLKQVFENLFRNAVQHGGDDVTVTVGDLPTGFYVEDDGEGIPPEERATILEAGYSTTSDGTGFGLSIVKQLVEAHGWSLRVTDGTDGGARFEITGVESATQG